MKISARLIRAWFGKNKPALMLATGIAGVTTTIVFSVRGHLKARKVIEDITEANEPMYYQNKKGDVKIRKKFWIKKTWKCYIPAAVLGSLSIGCLIGSYKINDRRNALLASSLAASEAAMTEYQKQVIDSIGEEAEKQIHDKFIVEQAKKDPSKPQVNSIYGLDSDLEVNCYEATTQQLFKNSKEGVRKAVNDLNQMRLSEFNNLVSLNDFYHEIGCEETELGWYIGWDIDHPVAIDIDAIEKNGIPCLYVHPKNFINFKGV